MPFVEDVFRLSGIPTYTFVEPQRYTEIKVSIRTPGRCLIVEGPSGIGKTTTITKIISDLGFENRTLSLSARKPDDIGLIAELPNMDDIGTVIVDDFHRLDDEIKSCLSDYMKILADAESKHSKLVLIGINKAGHQLIKFAEDLGLRVDIFRLEANPQEKVEELIKMGEHHLNININDKEKIASRAQGSFQIAQLLCHKICTLSEITEAQRYRLRIKLPVELVVEDVMVDLGRQFKDLTVTFAQGSKLRREGRAPYLHILRWLADGDDWSLDFDDALASHPIHRQSVGQVLEKGYLENLITEKAILRQHFHYEPSTRILESFPVSFTHSLHA